MTTTSKTTKAVLGPTNTGKTHFAIERMLAHHSGLIGLPLRLLAREVYVRIQAKVGKDKVALITGEERIVPEHAKYWVYTVEAMPQSTQLPFVAIDEIQTASSLERGHVFTDRILNLRGTEETLLLGAMTMAPVLQALIPNLEFLTRPRLSTLTYVGSKNLSRLNRRSAIVTFSADDVYATAELIRRQRGGAAVVMGALSPRTRNAQVELYQSGDVDFIVATDAIGMGLNLDIEHIAFAGTQKFDGYQMRALIPSELAQIAGRAGRHTVNGTFGVSSKAPLLDAEVVRQIEAHDFEPFKQIQWRNNKLDFSGINALLKSLNASAPHPCLSKALPATDQLALEYCMRQVDIMDRIQGEQDISLLWDVCSIPDYRKISPNNHGDYLATIYSQLHSNGLINETWAEQEISRTDNVQGNIDVLAHRITQIRTWTFISNRADWLENKLFWTERTRDIEDRLSDALHEQLIHRFIDRRTSILMKSLREKTMLESEIDSSGQIMVEGQAIGRLQGLRFTQLESSDAADAKAIKAAAQKTVAAEIKARVKKITQAPNEDFILTGEGIIRWKGEVVAQIGQGHSVLSPKLIVLADEHLTGSDLEQVVERLDLWLRHHINTILAPLITLRDAQDLEGVSRGLAFQLIEAMGLLNRTPVNDEIKSLDQEKRAILRGYGIRFGAHHIYLPLLLKPAPRSLALLLSAKYTGKIDDYTLATLPEFLLSGRTSMQRDPKISVEDYSLVGYCVCGQKVLRVDILERLADMIRPLTSWRPQMDTQKPDGVYGIGSFTVTLDMMSLLGCSKEDFDEVLKFMSYVKETKKVPKEQTEEQPKKNLHEETGKTDQTLSEIDITQPAPEETGEDQFDIIEIWRRKGKQPNSKRSRDKFGKQNKDDRHKKAKKNTASKAHSKRNTRVKPQEKKIDPNSPFAALQELKQQMDGSE